MSGLYMTAELDWHGAPGVITRAPEVVAKATLEVEAWTKTEIVAMGAVDTGHLLNSVHSAITGPLDGEVRVGANYARFVHDGHFYMNAPRNVAGYKFGEYLPAELWGLFPGRVRYAPPRPFLKNAVEIVKPMFVRAIASLIR